MKNKISKITANHYVKLVYRSLLFVAGIVFYIVLRASGDTVDFTRFIPTNFGLETVFLIIVWLAYTVEMVLRLFPSKHESMGCQKQFKRNFEPTGSTEIKLFSPKRTFLTVLAWLTLNGIIGALYYLKVIDGGALLLVSLAYGICDMVCILFFCPFHAWFFKSRCCSDCRIYNWDFAMIFTPFVFLLSSWFTVSLFALAMIILLRWEITLKVHPERFSRSTNKCLDCSRCEEKLCRHKKHLKNYLKKNKELLKK